MVANLEKDIQPTQKQLDEGRFTCLKNYSLLFTSFQVLRYDDGSRDTFYAAKRSLENARE